MNEKTPTSELSLYYLKTCPYCIRVLVAMKQLGLEIRLKNIRKEAAYREELIQGGGKPQVPCLRIGEDAQAIWIYESGDIVNFLRTRVA